jgi:hypothetical protein
VEIKSFLIILFVAIVITKLLIHVIVILPNMKLMDIIAENKITKMNVMMIAAILLGKAAIVKVVKRVVIKVVKRVILVMGEVVMKVILPRRVVIEVMIVILILMMTIVTVTSRTITITVKE